MMLVGGTRIHFITLNAVETGGIWVEGENLIESLVGRPASAELEKPKKLDLPQKIVLFFPYAQIQLIVDLSVELEP